MTQTEKERKRKSGRQSIDVIFVYTVNILNVTHIALSNNYVWNQLFQHMHPVLSLTTFDPRQLTLDTLIDVLLIQLLCEDQSVS